MLISRLPVETVDFTAMTAFETASGLLPRRSTLHHWLAAILVLELACVACAVRAMEVIYGGGGYSALQASAVLAGALAIWVLVAHNCRLYDCAAMLRDSPELQGAALAAAATFAIISLAAAGHRSEGTSTPGAQLIRQAGCAAAGTGLLLTIRLGWWRCLKLSVRRSRQVEQVLVVAETPLIARLEAARIERMTGGWIRVAGSIAVSPTLNHPANDLAEGYLSIEAIEAAIRANQFDRVLIVGSDDYGARTLQSCAKLVARLAMLAVDVTLIPNSTKNVLEPRSATRLGPMVGIDLVSRPITPAQAIVKRTMDIVVACLILAAAAPAMLLAAALIALETPGPVLFRQQRTGFHEQVFHVLKYRTMHTHLSDTAAGQTARDDPRVTRLGRLLRRVSFDELPQFFNVLAGTMSIVGPRPHFVGMKVAGQAMHDLVDSYKARHRVKPGITGWAQVNGCRGEIDSKQKLARRVALDCEYIACWSPVLDIIIMMRTAAMLAFDRQAY